jgi:hypothetical protein
MNFGQMQSWVSYVLDDLDFGYFTETQVKRWLNDAQYEAQKILIQTDENWFLKCLQTTLVIGQSDYALPDDFLKLNRLQIIQYPNTTNEVRTQIFPIVLSQQQAFTSNNAFPISYYIKKNRIVLVPPSDTAYTLRLDYTYLLGELSADSDESQIPIQYHEYVCLLGAITGFLKDDRNPSSLLAKKAWYEAMFKQDAEDRKVDSPREVVVTRQDGFWGGYY